MTDLQLYILTAVVIGILFLFVFGMFYINKRLHENRAIGKVIIVPIIISILLAITLFIIAFAQV